MEPNDQEKIGLFIKKLREERGMTLTLERPSRTQSVLGDGAVPPVGKRLGCVRKFGTT